MVKTKITLATLKAAVARGVLYGTKTMYFESMIDCLEPVANPEFVKFNDVPASILNVGSGRGGNHFTSVDAETFTCSNCVGFWEFKIMA